MSESKPGVSVPGHTTSTQEQAELVAQIARELSRNGMSPTAVLVAPSGYATVLLPSNGPQPAAPAQVPQPNGPIGGMRPASDMLEYATERQTIATLAGDRATSAHAASSASVDTLSKVASTSAKYDVFVSHCKRTDATEDRAIWVSDVMEAAGLRVFFDRSDLTEISAERLKDEVEASRVVVTILDPYTFDSEWVRNENAWAHDAGRPIVGLYDGDRHRWEAVCKWQHDFPHVFKRPVINYQKDYRVESKNRLHAAVRGAAEAAEAKGRTLSRSASSSDNALFSLRHGSVAHGSEEPLSSRDTTRPTPAPASLVRIAIGKSMLPDAADAVRGAWRHLVSKLSSSVPQFVIATYMGDYDAAELAAALSTVASAGCKIIGVSGGIGVMVEDAWVTNGTQPQELFLWGIADPLGAYEVLYTSRADLHGVKEGVKLALEPQVTRGLPRFNLCYCTPTFEANAVRGIQEICGEDALIVGLAIFGPKGFDIADRNLPTVFALTAGEPFDPAVQVGCGSVTAFCWPSVFIAGSFSPGGSPDPPGVQRPRTGVVSKVGTKSPPTFVERYSAEYVRRARAAQRDGPLFELTIVEINGRPAVDVFLEWLTPPEHERLLEITGGRIRELGVIPWDKDPAASLWITTLIIGVVCGQDGEGQTVYKQLTPCAFTSDGAIVLFGGVEVQEGDQVERLAVGDAAETRDHVTRNAHHIMQESGFDFDSVQGALVVGCGMFWVCGGFDDGLRQLSHKLGEALNWTPTLGLFGGPELGPMGRARSDWAVFTIGCIVFSSQQAKAPRLLLSNNGGSAMAVSSVFVG